MTMTQYTIYVDFVKIDIFFKLGKWEFSARDGSTLLCTGGNFSDHQEAEKHARQMVLQLKSIDHEKDN